MKATISIDDETMRKLRELAEARDQKLSAVITRLIRLEYAAAEKEKQ